MNPVQQQLNTFKQCNQLQLLIPPLFCFKSAWTVAKLQFLFECQISSASEISDHLQPEPKR